MALAPSVIAEELQKIPQFQATGTIVSSRIVNKDGGCLHVYESILDTGPTRVLFTYDARVGACITDGIFEIEEKPFTKNTEVTLLLTQSEPHRLVSSEVHYVPSLASSSSAFYMIGAAVFLLIAGAAILAIIKKDGSKRVRTVDVISANPRA